MKSTLKITSEGHVTLRKSVMDQLGVRPGDKITVEVLEFGRAEIKAPKPAGPLGDFVGCLHKPGGRALTIEEINDIIARGWAGEFAEADES